MGGGQTEGKRVVVGLHLGVWSMGVANYAHQGGGGKTEQREAPHERNPACASRASSIIPPSTIPPVPPSTIPPVPPSTIPPVSPSPPASGSGVV